MNRKNSVYNPLKNCVGLYDNLSEYILKFYQTTVRIDEFIKEENTQDNLEPFWDLPDGYLKRYKFDDFPKEINDIFDRFKIFLNDNKYIYFLPIFIFKNIYTIENGIYCIDISNNIAYKFKEIDNLNKIYIYSDFNICISYFLNLKNAIIKDGTQGFINGIVQIGQIYEIINNSFGNTNFDIKSVSVPQQQFTKMMGISCREQLFIKNQLVKMTL